MSIIEQVAQSIDTGAWMPLWEPHTKVDEARQRYLQSKALCKAVEVLTLSLKTPDLRQQLIAYEKNGWRERGVPIDTPELAAIVEAKFPTADHDTKRNPNAVALSELGSAKGGRARAKKLTPERRSEIARLAALSRWNTDDSNSTLVHEHLEDMEGLERQQDDSAGGKP